MATLDEIAVQAGVSKWTVSRVLSGEVAYQRPTFARRAERIRALASKMGYLPNAAARAVATGRFANVCLLCSTRSGQSRLPQQLLDSIYHALAQRDITLTVAALPDEDLTDPHRIPRMLRQRMVDGLLINYTHRIPPRMKELIHRHAGASIWLNAKLDTDCVYPDDVQGGALATQRLIDQGYRSIAYVDYIHGWNDLPQAHHSAPDRQAGYEQAMRQAGLTPRVIRYPEHVSSADRLAASLAWLDRPDRPQATVAYGSVASIVHAAMAIGLNMPADLGLVAIGDEPVSAGYGPVDTALVKLSMLGEVAVDALLTKLESPDRALPPRAVPLTMRLADPDHAARLSVDHFRQSLGPSPDSRPSTTNGGTP